jgi:protein-disulfide isomerase
MAKHQRENTLQVDSADHVRGSTAAPVTMLVYGDYECPYTRELELAVAGLRHTARDSFRYVFRYFPLREIHPHAQLAAEAAETVYALAGPDAFWKMHDALFANQEDLEVDSVGRLAAAAGVDPTAFRATLKTRRFAERIERDVRSGEANGVEGTPSVFINGERYRGSRDIASLRGAVAAPSK